LNWEKKNLNSVLTYEEFLKQKEERLTKNTKICSHCKQEKNKSEFSVNKQFRDGLHYQCKECRKETRKKYDHSEKAKDTKKKYYELEEVQKRLKEYGKSDNYKNSILKNKYNITLEEYNNMLKKQNNKCLICNRETKLVVDHDHKTKKIRGLLCNMCNGILGMFEKYNLLAENFINYLKG
jgi:hypothetical protein